MMMRTFAVVASALVVVAAADTTPVAPVAPVAEEEKKDGPNSAPVAPVAPVAEEEKKDADAVAEDEKSVTPKKEEAPVIDPRAKCEEFAAAAANPKGDLHEIFATFSDEEVAKIDKNLAVFMKIRSILRMSSKDKRVRSFERVKQALLKYSESELKVSELPNFDAAVADAVNYAVVASRTDSFKMFAEALATDLKLPTHIVGSWLPIAKAEENVDHMKECISAMSNGSEADSRFSMLTIGALAAGGAVLVAGVVGAACAMKRKTKTDVLLDERV